MKKFFGILLVALGVVSLMAAAAQLPKAVHLLPSSGLQLAHFLGYLTPLVLVGLLGFGLIRLGRRLIREASAQP